MKQMGTELSLEVDENIQYLKKLIFKKMSNLNTYSFLYYSDPECTEPNKFRFR